MNKKPSALSVLAKMADLDLKEFVFAFPLNTNFKYARTGREGWGEVTIAVTNHIIANIDKFSGSLYMADKDAYADIEKTLEQEGAAFDEMKVRAEKAEAQVAALTAALREANEDAARLFFAAISNGYCCQPHAKYEVRRTTDDSHAADCPITLHRARVGGAL